MEIKPVRAWGVLYRGRIMPSLTARRRKQLALIPSRNEQHVRVEIRVVPKKRKKVKHG